MTQDKQLEDVRTHELKTWSEYFQQVKHGKKTFEVRKNDRDFNVGDILLLKEGDFGGYGMTEHDLTFIYTGEEIKCVVLSILDGGKFGIQKGYCIMSIKVVDEKEHPQQPISIEAISAMAEKETPLLNVHDGSFQQGYIKGFTSALGYSAMSEDLKQLLHDLEEYFDGKEDIDNNGLPNREMKFLTQIQNIQQYSAGDKKENKI